MLFYVRFRDRVGFSRLSEFGCWLYDSCTLFMVILFFFFKQKTAYEMRISDWSSDVCSSDLYWQNLDRERAYPSEFVRALTEAGFLSEIGRRRVGKECVSTCRSRWSPYH